MLVQAWARVRPDGWRLRIAGPDEADHRKQVEKAVSAAGLGEVISFTGPIGHRMKKSAFFDADLFVLPSHSESFGIAVAEALAHGLPVLTTKGTPWSILPESGCGWWVDATVDGIAQGLRQATILDSDTLQAMGAKGRALAIAEFGWKRVAKAHAVDVRVDIGQCYGLDEAAQRRLFPERGETERLPHDLNRLRETLVKIARQVAYISVAAARLLVWKSIVLALVRQVDGLN